MRWSELTEIGRASLAASIMPATFRRLIDEAQQQEEALAHLQMIIGDDHQAFHASIDAATRQWLLWGGTWTQHLVDERRWVTQFGPRYPVTLAPGEMYAGEADPEFWEPQ